MARLDEFAELPRGWLNGTGDAIDPAALALAREVVTEAVALWLVPLTAPTCAGDVMVEVERGERWAAVECVADGVEVERMEAGHPLPCDDWRDALRWVSEAPVEVSSDG